MIQLLLIKVSLCKFTLLNVDLATKKKPLALKGLYLFQNTLKMV